jgi:hypothetical protein
MFIVFEKGFAAESTALASAPVETEAKILSVQPTEEARMRAAQDQTAA